LRDRVVHAAALHPAPAEQTESAPLEGLPIRKAIYAARVAGLADGGRPRPLLTLTAAARRCP